MAETAAAGGAAGGAGRRVWGWWMFDWASQPYATLLLTFIFGPYFATAVMGDPVAAQAAWGFAIASAGIVIALCAPLLGAMADASGRHMRWIAFFSVFYVLGSGALWLAAPGTEEVWLILFLFCLGLAGMEFATIFTNAMLPGLGPRAALGRISGTGWALGYAGGVVSLVVMLLFFAEDEAGRTLLGTPPAFGLDPEAREGTRMVGPFTALWYVVFMVPFFLWVRPEIETRPGSARPSDALRALWGTIRSLPARRSLAAYLGASMVYRDALSGLYTFGGIYTAGVLGWGPVDLGTFGIIAAVTAAAFSWAGGWADSRWGPKPVIRACVCVLLLVSLLVATISRERVLLFDVAEGSALPDLAFYVLGAVIGAAGGALQSASRTMLVRQVAPDRQTEGFGLYALAGKATAFLAPALIGVATLLSGSQQVGVLPLAALFILGLIALRWVDPEGERP